jgi:hypothetical protein
MMTIEHKVAATDSHEVKVVSCSGWRKGGDRRQEKAGVCKAQEVKPDCEIHRRDNQLRS